MTGRVWRFALVAALILTLAACQAAQAGPRQSLGRAAGVAPALPFDVGVRTLTLSRGEARPLPTTVWYPAETASTTLTRAETAQVADVSRAITSQHNPATVRRDARPAAGRFPIVLFSHGLSSSPELFTALTTRWASAGFVVAAPTYPYTNAEANPFQRWDVRNQPGDAEYVIEELIRLDTLRGDPFRGRLAVDHIAAAGHSAGGFTTAGLFTTGHHPRLRAGIVIAGGGLPGTFAGPEASMLFVHGGADPIVAPYVAKAAYDRVPWPKAFLTLAGQGHGEYLTPGRRGFRETYDTMTDFLRWSLYGDRTARARLTTDATLAGVSAIVGRI